MKVSEKTIEYLRDIISGDSKKTNYLSGYGLVNFFNHFGFNDDYGQGFPSRWYYCQEKLSELNKLDRIQEVIEYYYHPINFIENPDTLQNLVKEINKYLMFDELKLVVNTKNATLNKYDAESQVSQASLTNDSISILVNKDIFNHIKSLLESEHYFNAIEEAYKIVREKLKEITGKEQAHKAFSENNYTKIFGREAVGEIEKDFFDGIKFLHMAIQKLRNEKAHTPAQNIDKNLALHYIVLASLAYDLINKEKNDTN